MMKRKCGSIVNSPLCKLKDPQKQLRGMNTRPAALKTGEKELSISKMLPNSNICRRKGVITSLQKGNLRKSKLTNQQSTRINLSKSSRNLSLSPVQTIQTLRAKNSSYKESQIDLDLSLNTSEGRPVTPDSMPALESTFCSAMEVSLRKPDPFKGPEMEEKNKPRGSRDELEANPQGKRIERPMASSQPTDHREDFELDSQIILSTLLSQRQNNQSNTKSLAQEFSELVNKTPHVASRELYKMSEEKKLLLDSSPSTSSHNTPKTNANVEGKSPQAKSLQEDLKTPEGEELTQTNSDPSPQWTQPEEPAARND
ncbi:uncharacterized protein LOC143838775 [Paroedura picta]|uniref:uncharacterized protein LOC143838775 n=1 Tax=Paroedura picta TaxID=143630 RepID=UPI004057C705